MGWLGAVQSQDFGPAKWSVGRRTQGATDAELDQAYAAGTILRTHVLRPTWHFVLPADIRWLLAATAPRDPGAQPTGTASSGSTPTTLGAAGAAGRARCAAGTS